MARKVPDSVGVTESSPLRNAAGRIDPAFRLNRSVLVQPLVSPVKSLSGRTSFNFVTPRIDTNYVQSKSSKSLFAAIALWLTLVSCGIAFMWNFQNASGAQGNPPNQWPQESHIKSIPQLPTLVLAIHPHCPCSRATIGELALLMAHVQGLVNANVLFVKPPGFSEDWEKTDLWRSAASIPGVKVMTDDNGVEAAIFRSQTSGQAMLYDVQGHLVFSGGITNSRGHSGDNDGRGAILSQLTTGSAINKEAPVFGCPLFEASSEKPTEEFCNGVHPR